jgi:HEAT repeat protein
MSEENPLKPPQDIPFDEVISALLDDQQVLDPRYLYPLSDLSGSELRRLWEIWGEIELSRRRGMMEDLERLTETNTLLSFESIFRRALNDRDDQVRFFAARAIETFDTDDLIPDFLEILAEDQSADVRAVTASILGKYIYRGELDKISSQDQEQIEDALLTVLDSDQPDRVRQSALEAMGYSPRPEAHREIQKAYQSGEPAWIASALFAMGRSFDHRYDEMVLEHLQHTSPEIRREAVRACGELYLEDAVPVLLDLLDDLGEVRRAAIWALSQIGGEEAGPAISQLLEGNVSEEEYGLIQEALERLSFLDEGVTMPLFDLPLDEEDQNYVEFDDDFDDEDAYWYS